MPARAASKRRRSPRWRRRRRRPPRPRRPRPRRRRPRRPRPNGAKADISYDDFSKLEIKIAKVLACVPVEGADKLYKLELEIEGGAKRTVVSGIRPWYKEDELVGREVVYLANLAPKKLRGVMSQGMILAAHSQEGGAVLLKPEKGVFPGSKVS